MALFNECRERHAHIALDTADIVRDGDLSTTISFSLSLNGSAFLRKTPLPLLIEVRFILKSIG